tara:strand:+ start:260 stop:1255 length:996 start_codon:yes stop_codon:yes gene_type:complete
MKIAIVKLSALGDIVHAMVVLQFIKKYNPQVLVDWIVDEDYKDLLENHPNINKVHTVKLKKAKQTKSLFLLINEVSKVRNFGTYDLVIDMQGLIKSALISRLISSKVTLGFDKKSIRESFASIFYNKTFNINYDTNVIERNFELIKFALKLKCRKDEIYNKLPFLFSNSKNIILNYSKVKKIIILVPGASHSSKRYPIEKFAEVTNLLDANYIVIWGNNEEKLLANKIKIISPSVTVCKKLSIIGLTSLISQANLVIGSDTGPTHISWALNIPSITLFGSTPGYRNTFITDTNKVIESSSKVNPFMIDKNDYSIADISTHEIVRTARALLL